MLRVSPAVVGARLKGGIEMAKENIVGYTVYMQPGAGSQPRLGLINGGGQVFFKYLSGPEELLALVDLLRNEKPISYYPESGWLVVGYEYVGEEDHTA